MTEGRDEWLEEAMKAYEVSLFRMCWAYLGDSALAEDAVQDTFVKAYRGYSGFRDASLEKTWLMRIAMNTCKDVRRSAWFRRIDRSAALDRLAEGHEAYTQQDDTLTRAVLALPTRLREVVLLHYYQEMSAMETAKALGISRATVYNRLDKAHALLRQKLGEWYYA